MSLKELLDTLTTKHIKQIVRAHNLHTRIYLGSSREVMIDGLINHYNLKNTNELLSKIHTLTIPTEDTVIPKRGIKKKAEIVKVKKIVNISRKNTKQPEPEPEPEPQPEPEPEPVIKQPRDVSGLVSAIKSRNAKKQLIEEAKEELKQLREKKQKDEEAEKARKALIKTPRDVSGLITAVKNKRAKEKFLNEGKKERKYLSDLENDIFVLREQSRYLAMGIQPLEREHKYLENVIYRQIWNEVRNQGITPTNEIVMIYFKKDARKNNLQFKKIDDELNNASEKYKDLEQTIFNKHREAQKLRYKLQNPNITPENVDKAVREVKEGKHTTYNEEISKLLHKNYDNFNTISTNVGQDKQKLRNKLKNDFIKNSKTEPSKRAITIFEKTGIEKNQEYQNMLKLHKKHEDETSEAYKLYDDYRRLEIIRHRRRF